jgi:hypothetical protein
MTLTTKSFLRVGWTAFAAVFAVAASAQGPVPVIDRSGVILAEVDSLRQALGCAAGPSEATTIIRLSDGRSSTTFFLGGYLGWRGLSLMQLEAPPTRANGRTFVPAKAATEALGGRFEIRGASISVRSRDGRATPVQVVAERLPEDPRERLVYRLQNAPIALETAQPYALMNERYLAALQNGMNYVRPVVPSLQRVSGNSTLSSLSVIPGIGAPAAVVKTAAVSAEKAIEAIDWGLGVDQQLAKPLRQAIYASNQFLQAPGSDRIDPLISAYNELAQTTVKYELVGMGAGMKAMQFHQAWTKLLEGAQEWPVIGKIIPQGNSSSAWTAIMPVVQAISRQSQDLRAFSRAVVEDARAAKRLASGEAETLAPLRAYLVD